MMGPSRRGSWEFPPPKVDKVHAYVREMLEAGAICPSQSPWCNAVVLVCKKDRGLQFCIDFHKLNARTKKVSYLFPQIQETVESLVGARYFSCLDLKASFWQIAMDEALKQYTAFTLGNLGFFECKCMLLGLFNAPAMFHRLMQNCLGELNMTYCLINLDDVIVFSKMEEEHSCPLCIVFEHFREHHLKLKPTKCQFFRSEINYLAHHVSKDGVWPSKENLKAVAEFTPPWTYTEILAFLGLVGHYRGFIKGFAHIVQPLHEHLLEKEPARRANEWCSWITCWVHLRLNKSCFEAPVLAFADFNKLFLLETDASKLELGAVLSQKQTDGWYHLVAYTSQSLTVHQCNYHSTKQEFLALKWAITEQFQEWLLWKPFIVKTDSNPLTYIMTTPNLDATQHCWVESLARFTFSIEYQMGWDNAATDALSHITLKLDAETEIHPG